jgi:ATP-dependent exoDNAse (exonuclease V) beta subunit
MHALEWLRFKNIIQKEMLPEFILYSKELGIAGTIDLLVKNIDGSYDIYDWKTSKKIEMNPYRGKCGILGPALTVGDCNFNHYSLQLSLYRYILETYYGIRIRYTVLYHLNGVHVVPYRTDYLKQAIEDMLEFSSKAPERHFPELAA